MLDRSLFAGLDDLDGHATDPETFALLFEVLTYVRPHVIVEAGTYRGHFAFGAARLLPEARVFSSDIVKADCGRPATPANLTLFVGDFEAMLATLTEAPDFAFVDSGGGDEEGVRLRHWRAAQAGVRVGGLVACHDTLADGWMGGREIGGQGVRLQGGRGLTLWQRKS